VIDDLVPQGGEFLDEVLLEIEGGMVGGNVNAHAASVAQAGADAHAFLTRWARNRHREAQSKIGSTVRVRFSSKNPS
jgi:hypothetical protein